MRTHYDNLHITETAGLEVIKAAYKALAQKWHPDKNHDQREKAERAFKIITRAYEVVSDPALRRKYDDWLKEQRSVEPDEPEPEAVNEPPTKNQSERTTEAWADGKRSREQGFSSSDCPYDGNMADAWKAGFNAGKEGPGQTKYNGAAAVKTSLLGRLWRGEEGLGKTFWLYGVIGVIVVFVLSFVLAFAIAEDSKNIEKVTRFAQNFYIVYLIFVSICIWRAAGKIRPLGLFQIVARGFCLIPALTPVLAAFIIPSMMQGKDQAESASASGPWTNYQQQASTSQIDSFLDQPVQPSAPAAPAQTKPDPNSAAEVNAAFEYAFRKYPFINGESPNANGTAINEAIAIQDAYVAKGYPLSQAIRIAVDAVGPKYAR
jgi:curved DNA-binding protein CbpA